MSCWTTAVRKSGMSTGSTSKASPGIGDSTLANACKGPFQGGSSSSTEHPGRWASSSACAAWRLNTCTGWPRGSSWSTRAVSQTPPEGCGRRALSRPMRRLLPPLSTQTRKPWFTSPTNNLHQRSPTTQKSFNRYQISATQDRLIRSIRPIDVCLETQKCRSVTNLTKQGVGELINCAGQTDSLFDRFAIPGHPSF